MTEPTQKVARHPLPATTRFQERALTAAFAQTWFDLLSEHAPVEKLLPYVADEGLEMEFPERTLRSHADFVDWYGAVGEAFAEQSHVLDELSPHEVGVELTVVWRALQVADGTRLAMRVNQEWQLERTTAAPERRIVTYRVVDMTPL